MTENCPAIDLHTGPRVIQEGNVQDGDPAVVAGLVPVSPGREIRSPEQADNFSPSITNEFRQTSDDPQPDRLVHEIGLVSVTGGQDPRYIVSRRF